ncbi:hypothetical protein MNBD_NITROSPINAE02-790 [hydrothermal vent metagenome]|uniref:DUF8042 domain-containing protein n=1 Tax=hydrothermal vent metagenome TaxID=652676 RepID=A0A3B1C4V2_9ZZZZ
MDQIIKVNDKKVSIDTSGLKTVSDLIEALLKGSIGSSELIKSVQLDDNLFGNESFKSTRTLSIVNCRNISINTIVDPKGAAIELIARMEIYLASFSDGLTEVADRFRAGAIEEANAMLVSVIEGLQSLTELVETAKEFSGSDPGSLKVGEEDLSVHETRLIGILENLHDAQEAKDWVVVADLLEYELGPSIDEWREILPRLSDSLKGETGQ